MSSLRKPAQLIAPESARLLREARRAKRMGFDRAAEELAMQGFAQKGTEPSIWKSGQRQDMADLKQSLENTEIQKAQENDKQQLAGRIMFADELKKKAAQGDQDTWDYAKQESSKYGVTPSALASFFQRNKMAYNPSKAVRPEVLAAQGLVNAIDLPGGRTEIKKQS